MSTVTEQERTIPIADPELGERERERVSEVLASGRLAAGETVSGFESSFAEFCGAEAAVATSNGTTALHAALEALGIGEGDTVVTTPFSFIASANAIKHAGAEPVFADVDPETLNLDPHAVRSVVQERDDVAAILAVHLYGLPADMNRLLDIADDHDLAVVEDAAQAHGARYEGAHVGTLGDVGCFSFYPTKNMTTGEGGAIVTDSADVSERARRFVDHGRTGSYQHAEVGHNFRMTNIAAAIGLVQLERLPAFNRARRANAARLTEALDGVAVDTPVEPDERRHVYHQYTVQVDDRGSLRQRLEEAGVDSAVYYPKPIHEQPAYDHVSVDAPVAERAAEEVLSVPVHPGCSDADIDRIAAAVTSLRYDDTA